MLKLCDLKWLETKIHISCKIRFLSYHVLINRISLHYSTIHYFERAIDRCNIVFRMGNSPLLNFLEINENINTT